ncbi:hypothetical protein K402DRAFT_81569 [Aulographum hederae CBS 113979]|uniref:Uncharacterized protein n=1 Tax=Aulographum hederae CBS 113979 TaxID=1176131 RepID=A0A6G1H0E5_9PEZI|nr:hypothetical protein K402DRAFT_81569 [Aulographum hederae CBS 113979]
MLVCTTGDKNEGRSIAAIPLNPHTPKDSRIDPRAYTLFSFCVGAKIKPYQKLSTPRFDAKWAFPILSCFLCSSGHVLDTRERFVSTILSKNLLLNFLVYPGVDFVRCHEISELPSEISVVRNHILLAIQVIQCTIRCSRTNPKGYPLPTSQLWRVGESRPKHPVARRDLVLASIRRFPRILEISACLPFGYFVVFLETRGLALLSHSRYFSHNERRSDGRNVLSQRNSSFVDLGYMVPLLQKQKQNQHLDYSPRSFAKETICAWTFALPHGGGLGLQNRGLYVCLARDALGPNRHADRHLQPRQLHCPITTGETTRELPFHAQLELPI